MRGVPVALLLLAVLLVTTGGAEPVTAPFAHGLAIRATGPLRVANSRAGRPVLHVRALAPGHRARGTVALRNPGRDPLVLRLRAQTDGGFGRILRLRVDGPGGRVYEGPWSGLGGRALGRLGGRSLSTFAFTASLPRDTPNFWQGARAAARFSWVASAVPPLLRLAAAPRQRRAGARRLYVLARCSRPCRLVVRGRVRAGRRTWSVRGRARVRRAGTRVRIAVPLPVRARRALSREARHGHTVSAAFRVTAAAGRQRSARTLRLRRRPRHTWRQAR
jgi:hypothetical protein